MLFYTAKSTITAKSFEPAKVESDQDKPEVDSMTIDPCRRVTMTHKRPLSPPDPHQSGITWVTFTDLESCRRIKLISFCDYDIAETEMRLFYSHIVSVYLKRPRQ